jgi:chemotaxis protein CheD
VSAPTVVPASVDVEEIVVNIADFAVASGASVLTTAGLGSCVAKYADTGVALLVEELRRRGAAQHRVVAKLVGGARMFAALISSGVNMGQRNIDATRKALYKLNIPVVAEDVGGEYGRSVRLVAATGVLTVRSIAGGDREL